MKTLFLECNMGAAGDMLLAALLELTPNPKETLAALNALGIPHVRYFAEPSEKCGILGTHMAVTVYDQEEDSWEGSCMEQVAHDHDDHDDHDHIHPHEHHHHEHDQHSHGHSHSHEHDSPHSHEHPPHSHSAPHEHYGMAAVKALIDDLSCSSSVKARALAVYRRIAQAEAKAHGRPIDQVHFHEVGSLDAVADVVGVCLLLERLAPERIVVSPIATGFGQVRCAHGILPVPAPATATLLEGVPCRAGNIEGELCTPTGAALLCEIADAFSEQPLMTLLKTGYGMGKKNFSAANCLRALLGESQQEEQAAPTTEGRDSIYELCCNLDDMTGEAIGFALERLLEEGALDAFSTPIQMKRSRPATLLTCLCHPQERERMTQLLFAHTSTLGVRETPCQRSVLAREVQQVQTAYGPIRIKCAEGFGVSRQKPEYEDVAAAARAHQVSFTTVYQAAMAPKERG